MAEKTILEKAADKVGYGLAMAEDVAGSVKTAFGGAVATVTEALTPAKKASEPLAKKAAVKSAPQKTSAKKAAKKTGAKKSPIKRSRLKGCEEVREETCKESRPYQKVNCNYGPESRIVPRGASRVYLGPDPQVGTRKYRNHHSRSVSRSAALSHSQVLQRDNCRVSRAAVLNLN
jgi:hypothetical protein